MDAFQIAPDVIPVLPEGKVTVKYPSGVAVELGNELTPTQVKDRPTVSWDADSQAFYTLIMTDPDVPNRASPQLGEVRHWLVVNIPGCQLERGDEVTEYIGSGAPQGTGLHRYVFLVYRQAGLITVEPSLRQRRSQKSTRLKWKAAEFARAHSLGNPVAGNLFRAQYDDYVPLLHAQFEK